MARPGIEFKDVERIARRLFSQGMTPSVQKIRNELGTGSNTTIAKHLSTWRESFSEGKSPALPESVPEDLMNPIDDFWSTAVARAESNYQKFKEELEARLAEAESDKQQAVEQLEGQSQENSRLTRELNEVNTDLQELDRKNSNLEGKNEAIEKELNNVQQLNGQMMDMSHEQRQSFDTALSEMQVNHQKEVSDIQDRSDKTENRLLMEIDQLRQSVKKHETKQKEERDLYRKQIDTLQQREVALQADLHKLQQEHIQAKTALSHAEKDTDKAINQVASLQSQLAQSIETIESFSGQFDLVKKKETGIAEQIDNLSKVLLVIHHDIKEISNDHPDKD